MKFIVDAQLPRRLARWMTDAGFDTFHTLDLPLQNKTTDSAINQLSFDEEKIVITKDSDFVDSFLLYRRPWKLLLISTGNIRNSELEVLLMANINGIFEAFEAGALFVELSRTSIIVHV